MFMLKRKSIHFRKCVDKIIYNNYFNDSFTSVIIDTKIKTKFTIEKFLDVALAHLTPACQPADLLHLPRQCWSRVALSVWRQHLIGLGQRHGSQRGERRVQRVEPSRRLRGVGRSQDAVVDTVRGVKLKRTVLWT